MKGVFSFDLLLAAIILSLLIPAVTPNWEGFVKAEKIAICHYLKDLATTEVNLANLSEANIKTTTYADSWISVNLSTMEINVWKGECG